VTNHYREKKNRLEKGIAITRRKLQDVAEERSVVWWQDVAAGK